MSIEEIVEKDYPFLDDKNKWNGRLINDMDKEHIENSIKTLNKNIYKDTRRALSDKDKKIIDEKFEIKLQELKQALL